MCTEKGKKRERAAGYVQAISWLFPPFGVTYVELCAVDVWFQEKNISSC